MVNHLTCILCFSPLITSCLNQIMLGTWYLKICWIKQWTKAWLSWMPFLPLLPSQELPILLHSMYRRLKGEQLPSFPIHLPGHCFSFFSLVSQNVQHRNVEGGNLVRKECTGSLSESCLCITEKTKPVVTCMLLPPGFGSRKQRDSMVGLPSRQLLMLPLTFMCKALCLCCLCCSLYILPTWAL